MPRTTPAAPLYSRVAESPCRPASAFSAFACMCHGSTSVGGSFYLVPVYFSARLLGRFRGSLLGESRPISHHNGRYAPHTYHNHTDVDGLASRGLPPTVSYGVCTHDAHGHDPGCCWYPGWHLACWRGNGRYHTKRQQLFMKTGYRFCDRLPPARRTRAISTSLGT